MVLSTIRSKLLGPQGTNNSRLALWLFFVLRLAPIAAAVFAIFLGYHLFILGVTGEASLIIGAEDVGGQLINAAPGLFLRWAVSSSLLSWSGRA